MLVFLEYIFQFFIVNKASAASKYSSWVDPPSWVQLSYFELFSENITIASVFSIFCVVLFGDRRFLRIPTINVKWCTLLHKLKTYPSVFNLQCCWWFCVFQFGIVSFVEFCILHTPKSDVKCCALLHKLKSYLSVFTDNCVSVFSIFCIVSFAWWLQFPPDHGNWC